MSRGLLRVNNRSVSLDKQAVVYGKVKCGKMLNKNKLSLNVAKTQSILKGSRY